MKNYEGNRVCKPDKSKDQCNDHKEGWTKKPKNRENWKKITEKTKPWKKKQNRILKKPISSVKILLTWNQKNWTETGKKPSQTEKNRAKQVFVLK
jgi:hypothetical protein